MRGFTDRALILCPSPVSVYGKPDRYKTHLNNALNNIHLFCEHNLMDVCILCSDQIAVEYVPKPVVTYSTLTKGDLVFMKQHNPAFKKLENRELSDKYNDIIKQASVKNPIEKGLIVDQRFSIIVKRESFVSRKIIQDFRLVFNIQPKNSKQYKAKTKDGDTRIVVNIDAFNFVATTEMSGKVMTTSEVIGLQTSNRPVYEWKVGEEYGDVLRS